MILQRLMDDLSHLTVVEAAQLVKELEIRWGVEAARPAPPIIAPPTGPEPTEFNVVLEAAGENRIAVVREVRALTGRKLLEARDLVNSAPSVLLEGLSAEDAEKARAQLEQAGARIEVRAVE